MSGKCFANNFLSDRIFLTHYSGKIAFPHVFLCNGWMEKNFVKYVTLKTLEDIKQICHFDLLLLSI